MMHQYLKRAQPQYATQETGLSETDREIFGPFMLDGVTGSLLGGKPL